MDINLTSENNNGAKFSYGSLMPPIIRLVMSALGIGVLGTYSIYCSIGIIPGLLLNIAMVLSFIFTASLMVFGYFKTNKSLSSLGDLFGQTIGKIAKTIFDLALFFFIIFAMTGLLGATAGTFFNLQKERIVDFLGGNGLTEGEIKKKFLLRALPIICCLLLLLLIPKNVSFLSYMGMISFGVYVYLSLVIIF